MFSLEQLADPSFAENRLPAHSDHLSFAGAAEMAVRASLDRIGDKLADRP